MTIRPLLWDDNPKIRHTYKCVASAFVELPVQGKLESHISICEVPNSGFKATLWLMNGGIDIAKYCTTIEASKKEAEKWWTHFVSRFLLIT